MHISDLFWSIPILSACGMNLKDPSTNHPPTASMLTLGTSASVAASSGLAFSRVLCCSGRKVGKGWEWVGKVIKWGTHGTLCLGSVPFRLHITTVTFPCSPRMYIVEGVHRQSLSLLMNQRIGLQFLRLGPELTQTGESNRISCVWLQGNVHSKKTAKWIYNIHYSSSQERLLSLYSASFFWLFLVCKKSMMDTLTQKHSENALTGGQLAWLREKAPSSTCKHACGYLKMLEELNNPVKKIRREWVLRPKSSILCSKKYRWEGKNRQALNTSRLKISPQ